MRKKWGIIGMLMLATACMFTGCQAKESETDSLQNEQQETKEAEQKKSGKEYSGIGYKLYLDEAWIQQEIPGTEMYFEYGERKSEEDWLPSIYTEVYFLDNYSGNPGTYYNAEMQMWKANGFEVLSSEKNQEGAVTYFRTELEISGETMLQYFVIQHNTKYRFVLIPNDNEELYDDMVATLDRMIAELEWEEIVREEVDMAAVTPKAVSENDVASWTAVKGTGYSIACSEFWYQTELGADMAVARGDVLDGFQEIFTCTMVETTESVESGYARMENMLSGDGFEVIESGTEVQVGGHKGYSLVTKQELKYADIYRQTFYTVVNGFEYAFTFQADAADYAYLAQEKDAMLGSIAFGE